MREIKFRAWDKTTNKMYEVHSINNINKDVWLELSENIITGANFFEIELMQYTGLRDKNGKEIYEGDIVKINFLGNDFLYMEYIQWHERQARFRVTNYNGGSDRIDKFDCENDFAVVGNIYENPELLKKL